MGTSCAAQRGNFGRAGVDSCRFRRLIDFLTGVQPVSSQISGYIEAEQLQTTGVTCFELLSGTGENKRGRAVRQLLDALVVLPLDTAASRQAAHVRRQLEQIGQDSLIAGIALAHSLPLFTRNRAHFERVEKLELIKITGVKP